MDFDVLEKIQQIANDDEIEELKKSFEEVQQPRSDYILRHFVVGEKDHDTQKYVQCVIELEVKYNLIRRARLQRKIILIEITRLEEKDDEISKIKAEMKRIGLEEQDRAIIGAVREFECLYKIWKEFRKRYTHEEIEAAQEEYWEYRLLKQAKMDMLSTGGISVGNLDALKSIGHVTEEGKVLLAPHRGVVFIKDINE